MKKVWGLVLLGGLFAGALSGCAYGGAAGVGNNVVVLRNDAFLFGILRKAFVCKVSDAGLTNCNASEAP